jgi:hypothetical protein
VLAIADLMPGIDLDLLEPGQTLDHLTARMLVELGDVMAPSGLTSLSCKTTTSPR